MAQAQNLHASAVLLGDRGVLIAGESGCGKTTLALALLAHFRRLGHFSRLVSDDQVLIEAVRGQLVCRAPQAISGAVEIYGIGPRPVEFEPSMVADLVVRLVPSAQAQRFSLGLTESVAGCDLACLELAARNAQAAVLAVASWFSICPFRRETGDHRN